ncbi:MAG: hypothetical protein MJZ16_07980, partial [Bacteroidales bacterium]|nr:hypothetical protein [Bacteroidales bacterium]
MSRATDKNILMGVALDAKQFAADLKKVFSEVNSTPEFKEAVKNAAAEPLKELGTSIDKINQEITSLFEALGNAEESGAKIDSLQKNFDRLNGTIGGVKAHLRDMSNFLKEMGLNDDFVNSEAFAGVIANGRAAKSALDSVSLSVKNLNDVLAVKTSGLGKGLGVDMSQFDALTKQIDAYEKQQERIRKLQEDLDDATIKRKEASLYGGIELDNRLPRSLQYLEDVLNAEKEINYLKGRISSKLNIDNADISSKEKSSYQERIRTLQNYVDAINNQDPDFRNRIQTDVEALASKMLEAQKRYEALQNEFAKGGSGDEALEGRVKAAREEYALFAQALINVYDLFEKNPDNPQSGFLEGFFPQMKEAYLGGLNKTLDEIAKEAQSAIKIHQIHIYDETIRALQAEEELYAEFSGFIKLRGKDPGFIDFSKDEESVFKQFELLKRRLSEEDRSTIEGRLFENTESRIADTKADINNYYNGLRDEVKKQRDELLKELGLTTNTVLFNFKDGSVKIPIKFDHDQSDLKEILTRIISSLSKEAQERPVEITVKPKDDQLDVLTSSIEKKVKPTIVVKMTPDVSPDAITDLKTKIEEALRKQKIDISVAVTGMHIPGENSGKKSDGSKPAKEISKSVAPFGSGKYHLEKGEVFDGNITKDAIKDEFSILSDSLSTVRNNLQALSEAGKLDPDKNLEDIESFIRNAKSLIKDVKSLGEHTADVERLKELKVYLIGLTDFLSASERAINKATNNTSKSEKYTMSAIGNMYKEANGKYGVFSSEQLGENGNYIGRLFNWLRRQPAKQKPLDQYLSTEAREFFNQQAFGKDLNGTLQKWGDVVAYFDEHVYQPMKAAFDQTGKMAEQYTGPQRRVLSQSDVDSAILTGNTWLEALKSVGDDSQFAPLKAALAELPTLLEGATKLSSSLLQNGDLRTAASGSNYDRTISLLDTISTYEQLMDGLVQLQQTEAQSAVPNGDDALSQLQEIQRLYDHIGALAAKIVDADAKASFLKIQEQLKAACDAIKSGTVTDDQLNYVENVKQQMMKFGFVPSPAVSTEQEPESVTTRVSFDDDSAEYTKEKLASLREEFEKLRAYAEETDNEMGFTNYLKELQACIDKTEELTEEEKLSVDMAEEFIGSLAAGAKAEGKYPGMGASKPSIPVIPPIQTPPAAPSAQTSATPLVPPLTPPVAPPQALTPVHQEVTVDIKSNLEEVKTAVDTFINTDLKNLQDTITSINSEENKISPKVDAATLNSLVEGLKDLSSSLEMMKEFKFSEDMLSQASTLNKEITGASAALKEMLVPAAKAPEQTDAGKQEAEAAKKSEQTLAESTTSIADVREKIDNLINGPIAELKQKIAELNELVIQPKVGDIPADNPVMAAIAAIKSDIENINTKEIKPSMAPVSKEELDTLLQNLRDTIDKIEHATISETLLSQFKSITEHLVSVSDSLGKMLGADNKGEPITPIPVPPIDPAQQTGGAQNFANNMQLGGTGTLKQQIDAMINGPLQELAKALDEVGPGHPIIPRFDTERFNRELERIFHQLNELKHSVQSINEVLVKPIGDSAINSLNSIPFEKLSSFTLSEDFNRLMEYLQSDSGAVSSLTNNLNGLYTALDNFGAQSGKSYESLFVKISSFADKISKASGDLDKVINRITGSVDNQWRLVESAYAGMKDENGHFFRRGTDARNKAEQLFARRMQRYVDMGGQNSVGDIANIYRR